MLTITYTYSIIIHGKVRGFMLCQFTFIVNVINIFTKKNIKMLTECQALTTLQN